MFRQLSFKCPISLKVKHVITTAQIKCRVSSSWWALLKNGTTKRWPQHFTEKAEVTYMTTFPQETRASV